MSFRIERGGTFGLVGESGSGKSTIGRTVLRLVQPDAGSIRFEAIDVRALDPEARMRLRRRMQITFQGPFSSLDPRVRIGRAIAEPSRLHRLRSGADVGQRVDELLRLVGLDPHHWNRVPHEFSGGQRVAIRHAAGHSRLLPESRKGRDRRRRGTMRALVARIGPARSPAGTPLSPLDGAAKAGETFDRPAALMRRTANNRKKRTQQRGME